MLKPLLLAAVATAAVSAAPASAWTLMFEPGKSVPNTGFTVIANFNNGTMSGFTTPDASLAKVMGLPNSGSGAAPGAASPYGTPYLSVLAGGSASYTFAQPVTAFQFDWGSVDSYNTLTVRVASQANAVVIPGSAVFPNAANGNQTADGTNGRFTMLGTSGERFTGITLTSSGNSFEMDNLAVGSVPEPATWGLMIVGLGLVGGSLRSRRRSVAFG